MLSLQSRNNPKKWIMLSLKELWNRIYLQLIFRRLCRLSKKLFGVSINLPIIKFNTKRHFILIIKHWYKISINLCIIKQQQCYSSLSCLQLKLLNLKWIVRFHLNNCHSLVIVWLRLSKLYLGLCFKYHVMHSVLESSYTLNICNRNCVLLFKLHNNWSSMQQL